MDNLTNIINKIVGVLGYDFYDTFIKSQLNVKRKDLNLKLDNELELKNCYEQW